MRLIWATRGHDWGFRFLRDAGFEDPLPAYEKAFENTGGGPEEFRRIGDGVAVRFPDPEGRKDRSGRLIPHDLVVYGELAAEIHSVDDALRMVWPQIAPVFDRAWAEPEGPRRQVQDTRGESGA